ncbi:MAG: hypothetical protein WCT53_02045 [Candidatus Gracilibacteria bacterium]|jgi:hypothetical protein
MAETPITIDGHPIESNVSSYQNDVAQPSLPVSDTAVAIGSFLTVDGHPITEAEDVSAEQRQQKQADHEIQQAKSAKQSSYDAHTAPMPAIAKHEPMDIELGHQPVDKLALRFQLEAWMASRIGGSTDLCCG